MQPAISGSITGVQIRVPVARRRPSKLAAQQVAVESISWSCWGRGEGSGESGARRRRRGLTLSSPPPPPSLGITLCSGSAQEPCVLPIVPTSCFLISRTSGCRHSRHGTQYSRLLAEILIRRHVILIEAAGKTYLRIFQRGLNRQEPHRKNKNWAAGQITWHGPEF